MIPPTLNESNGRRRADVFGNGAWARRIGIRLMAGLFMVAIAAPAVLADGELYGYVSSTGIVQVTNVPTDQRFGEIILKPRYHAGVSDQELEEAVDRYAREYRLSPALLLAVMKAESSFDPTVISKAGAVGLMQLIPETAIRHGVRNLYDTRDNIGGGAKHIRYLLDRFHGNIRLALAAYNAGEKKVDRYRQIPPFKETQSYVKKVMGYYRDYRSQAPGFLATASGVAYR
jgi:soluble lytic murein transglycosylase-like protein